MKVAIYHYMFLLLAVCPLGAAGLTDQQLGKVSADYEARLDEAASKLADTRATILEERSPLASRIQELENQVIQLNSRITRLDTLQADLENQQGSVDAELSSLSRNLDYAAMLSQELTAAVEASMQPGETKAYSDELKTLESLLENSDPRLKYGASMDTFDLALTRLKGQLGGHIRDGLAVMGDSNEVNEGQFLKLGPVTYFRDASTGLAGLAYLREGSLIPVVHPIRNWDRDTVEAVFSGNPGYFPADATGGKAIHLMEARGSVLDHVRKGGIVGYVIIALGIIALLTALMKLWDLRTLSVDNPDTIKVQIAQLNEGTGPSSAEPFAGLKQSCRELFDIALKHRDKPKELLEEIMFAYILLQRNLHERRLPMLRVIASSAPLLGLLGTVVGMIKTFTLITVVGTGNAANLSSGISVALVTTELGLIVAIPTLIIYGYLSHQTEKRLSLLEQYSIELANNLQWIKGGSTGEGEQPS